MIDVIKVSPQVSALFQASHLHYMIEAMVVGNSPAKVWGDDSDNPRSMLIWDQAHCLYLGGAANNPTFNQALLQFLMTSLLPQVQEQQLEVLKIYAADAQWEQTAAMLLQPLHPRLRQRSLYTLKLPTKEAKARELPQGFRVQPIDHNLLYQQTLTYHSQVLEEIESCWTSVEQFGREGFGFWVITERNEVVCWCTAEYVSPGKCGIGIETIEAYQERGLATVTAHAFLQHALSLGWEIYWDTWQGNIPSVRIAENFGFQKQVDYPVSLLILD